MTNHSELPISTAHPIHAWNYVDADARNAATGFVDDDLLKLAFQESDSTYWTLTGLGPAWTPFVFSSDAVGEITNLLIRKLDIKLGSILTELKIANEISREAYDIDIEEGD